MNRENIIKLAKESGFYIQDDEVPTNRQDFDLTKHLEHDLTKCLERFAKLIAEHERQECALLCYEQRKHWDALACADAIRAGTKPRGQA